MLIVDDNPLIRQALCELFTREGDFDVCAEAGDGKDAIEKAQLFHPDLIVTDLSMPVMNGLEEARALMKLMPTVPVIVFTAFLSSALEKEAAASGVSAIIAKSERRHCSNQDSSDSARPNGCLIFRCPSSRNCCKRWKTGSLARHRLSRVNCVFHANSSTLTRDAPALN